MTNLQDFLVEIRLLREHLELSAIGILVDLEVRFHDAELVVFERRPRSLRLAGRPSVHTGWKRALDAPGVPVHGGERRRFHVHFRPALAARPLLLRLVVVLERREFSAGQRRTVQACWAHARHVFSARWKPAGFKGRMWEVPAAARWVGKHGLVVRPQGQLLHGVVRAEHVGQRRGNSVVWRRREGGLRRRRRRRRRRVLDAFVVLLAIEPLVDQGVEVSLPEHGIAHGAAEALGVEEAVLGADD